MVNVAKDGINYRFSNDSILPLTPQDLRYRKSSVLSMQRLLDQSEKENKEISKKINDNVNDIDNLDTVPLIICNPL